MAQLSGTITVEDGIKKPEDYAPPRKVNVVINWVADVAEEAEAVFHQASAMAHSKVHELLHGTAPVASANTNTNTNTNTTKAATTRKAKDAAPKSDPAAVSEDPTGGAEHVIQLPDNSAVVDEVPVDGAKPTSTAGDAQTSADPSAIMDDSVVVDEWDVQPEASTKEVTDADLNSAVQKKNGELGNPAQIRELIGSYNPDKTKPFQLRQIVQSERGLFLSQLAALQKAAA